MIVGFEAEAVFVVLVSVLVSVQVLVVAHAPLASP